jgi:uncharacterized protein
VKEAGGSVLTAPFDVGDAGRRAVLADPAGASFCLWEAGTHKGAQLVNEPGTWNWSDLKIRDLEGAKAFYGELFGWRAETVAFEGEAFTMLLVPGYGDFLERRDPDLRRRQAAGGAPPGFEDAIAWMMPLTNDQDAAPHWSVTFAVDDTDAIANKAAELGGTVIVPPYDADVVRAAVLSDPHGAVFSVSRYQPRAPSR